MGRYIKSTGLYMANRFRDSTVFADYDIVCRYTRLCSIVTWTRNEIVRIIKNFRCQLYHSHYHCRMACLFVACCYKRRYIDLLLPDNITMWNALNWVVFLVEYIVYHIICETEIVLSSALVKYCCIINQCWNEITSLHSQSTNQKQIPVTLSSDDFLRQGSICCPSDITSELTSFCGIIFVLNDHIDQLNNVFSK